MKRALLATALIVYATSVHAGPWRTESDVSKFDDTRMVTLTQRLGKYTLSIRCLERRTEVYVDFGGLYMASSDSNEWGLMTYRADQRTAVTQRWNASTNHRALFMAQRDTISTLKQWSNAKRLLVRTIPVSESAVTAEFDLTGLKEALVPVRQACGWTETDERRQAAQDEASRRYWAAYAECKSRMGLAYGVAVGVTLGVAALAKDQYEQGLRDCAMRNANAH